MVGIATTATVLLVTTTMSVAVIAPTIQEAMKMDVMTITTIVAHGMITTEIQEVAMTIVEIMEAREVGMILVVRMTEVREADMIIAPMEIAAIINLKPNRRLRLLSVHQEKMVTGEIAALTRVAQTWVVPTIIIAEVAEWTIAAANARKIQPVSRQSVWNAVAVAKPMARAVRNQPHLLLTKAVRVVAVREARVHRMMLQEEAKAEAEEINK
jgi:hypothetical protein